MLQNFTLKYKIMSRLPLKKFDNLSNVDNYQENGIYIPPIIIPVC
jgi:hypothetical protein